MSSLSNISQIILRNHTILDAQHTLLINPPHDELIRSAKNEAADIRLSVWSNLYTTTQFFTKQAQAKQVIFDHCFQSEHFGALHDNDALPSVVILNFPKSKPELQFLLASLLDRYNDTSFTLYLVGDNKSGIKSAPKLLANYFENITKIDSAKHCLLFQASQPKPQKPFTIDDYWKSFVVETTEGHLSIYSLPGVFNHGKLDIGTAELLDYLPKESTGAAIDVACGSGVIGAVLKQKNPQLTLTCSDIHAAALASTKKTLAENQLEADVIPSDGLSEFSERVKYIVTNPPFHTGTKTDYAITEAMIRFSRRLLKINGQLLMVANSFLPYPQLLDHWFGEHEQKHRAKGFSVYQATLHPNKGQRQ